MALLRCDRCRGPCDFFETWADQVAFMVERRSSKHIGIYTVCRILCIYRVSYPVDARAAFTSASRNGRSSRKCPPLFFTYPI
jgi:hypothetical protein